MFVESISPDIFLIYSFVVLKFRTDKRFADNDGRMANWKPLQDALEEKLEAKTSEEWTVFLQNNKIPAGPCLTLPEVCRACSFVLVYVPTSIGRMPRRFSPSVYPAVSSVGIVFICVRLCWSVLISAVQPLTARDTPEVQKTV